METLAATFLLGLGSAATPCLLPLYPGFIAYLAGTRSGTRGRAPALLGLAVLLGLLTTMVLLGIVVSLLALPLTDVIRWSIPVVTVVLVGLGLLLLAGRNPFNRLASVQVPVVRNPLGQAYVYGLLAGPVALPCAGPFLIALLAISVGIGDGVTRVVSFAIYGLGFGLPLVALGAIGAARGQANLAVRRAPPPRDPPDGRGVPHRDRGVSAAGGAFVWVAPPVARARSARMERVTSATADVLARGRHSER